MYNRSIQPSDIDNLSNAELLELSENAPKVHPDAGVVKLTSGTVAKPSQDMDEDAPDPSEAAALDLERRTVGARGPLHGIPIILKDNIATLASEGS